MKQEKVYGLEPSCVYTAGNEQVNCVAMIRTKLQHRFMDHCAPWPLPMKIGCWMKAGTKTRPEIPTLTRTNSKPARELRQLFRELWQKKESCHRQICGNEKLPQANSVATFRPDLHPKWLPLNPKFQCGRLLGSFRSVNLNEPDTSFGTFVDTARAS